MPWKARAAALVNRALRPYDIRIVRGADLWHPMTQLGLQREPHEPPIGEPTPEAFIKSYLGRSVGGLQGPFDFAVAMPSILRPTIGDAIESVFAQDFKGRVQILIGVDALKGSLEVVERACKKIPPNQAVQVLYPGYSTSPRHGGVHADWVCGSLRTIISYLANSRYIAYLDDDNWYAPNHLSTLQEAIRGHDWAYSLRWYVHPESRRPICEDRWESVGPMRHGSEIDRAGWVDPNCLAVDKLACEAALRWWSIPLRNSVSGTDADRSVFNVLRSEFRGRGTQRATVFYTISESDWFRHSFRLKMIGAERYAAAGAEVVNA